MNIIQKAIYTFLAKASGFPAWQGSTTDIIPGGWGAFDQNGGLSGAGDLAAVYACWRVLCQTIGSVPWKIYKTDAKGTRTVATDHPLYPILALSPNAYMTSMEFREAMMLGFCSTGNGYAKRDLLGNRVVGLTPLRADWMTILMKDGSGIQPGDGLTFRYAEANGRQTDYTSDEIIHLKNFSIDGIRGLSPIQVHAITHARYTEQYAAAFMRNQGRPANVLYSDKPRPKQAADYDEKFRADWRKLYSGDGAGGTAVLWDGLKYQAISVAPNDAQYIETKKLNTADIAAIYGVPLNMLGQSDKTATYASAEQFQIDFVRHTIRPLAVRLEQVINKALFFKEPGTFCELDLDGLLRGDSKTQADLLRTLTDGGVMTRNEARRTLNLPERPEADQLTVRAYEIDLNALPKLSQEAQPGIAQGDVRKELPPPESKGFELRVEKMEQTVLPPKPMKKRGKVTRNADGSMSFEIEEIVNGE